MRATGAANDGVAFANVENGEEDSSVALTTGGRRKPPDKSKITCHKCGKRGHYASECNSDDAPEETTPAPPATGNSTTAASGAPNSNRQSGATLLMAGVESGEFDHPAMGFQFLQHDQAVLMKSDGIAGVPPTWILLDNQSTVDVFQNASLLKNIRTSNTQMDIHCNAGVSTTQQIGDLPGYGTVWYNPNGIANILSLSRVRERGYRVTYDSDNGNRFLVHKDNGTARVFEQSARGLFYMDVKNQGSEVSLVTTVSDNSDSYTQQDYSRAVLARKFQQIVGRPSTRTLLRIVDENLIPNCPVTREDILAAEHIFGPDVGSLKGKTVHRSSTPVTGSWTAVPAQLLSQYRDIVLAGDVMFVN